MNDYLESFIRNPWFWLPVIFIIPSAVIFWVTDLDIIISGLYFDPMDTKTPWEGSAEAGAIFLYKSLNVVTAVVVTGALLIMFIASATRKWRSLRLKAAYIFLTFALGPGLIVNAILKDYWGRPRPRDTVDFGAVENYVPPWKPNFSGEGRSFPSGHASAGFALLAFYWLAQRRRRQSGSETLVLASVLSYSALVGYARIAAGGHYLSDVIWAGWITAGVAYWLYRGYYKRAIAEAESAESL